MNDLAGLVGAAHVRSSRPDEHVDGVIPGVVVEPSSADDVAAVLAWASANQQSIVIRGGGTRVAVGRRTSTIDVVLSTRRLAQVLRYEPGDLTVTVEAGVTAAQLAAVLAAHRQCLPIDASSDVATIGGMLATNGSGPLRHRYGAPRDQVIGVRLATPDGRLASAGGHVVKNVAGYDLGKMVAGSFGSLAAIVSATFKLAPIPQVTSTLTVEYSDTGAAATAAAVLSAGQLDPMSVEIDTHLARFRGDQLQTYRLSVRFGGPAAVVATHIDRAAAALSPAGAGRSTRTTGDQDAAYWREYGTRIWAADGAVVKLSWMPASLEAVLVLLNELVRSGPDVLDEVDFQGRAAEGTGQLRLVGASAAIAAAIRRLRTQAGVVGNVVVMRADEDVKAREDVWGLAPGAAELGAALKRALDPAGVMNAGRGPL